MYMCRGISIALGAMLLAVVPVSAQSGKSLAKCEKAIGKEMTKYSGAVQKAIAKCLDKVGKEVLDAGGPIADAAKSCASALRKIENSEDATKTLSAKFQAKVAKACDPTSPETKATHTEAEVLDPNETGGIQAGLLDAYCVGFSGDGTLDTVSDWIACADDAAVCNALQQVAIEYPRGAGWLGDVASAIGALGAEAKYTDAQTVANAIRSRIDVDLDDVPDISCGHCGNGVLEAAESCDFGQMNGETCTSQLGEEAVGTLNCAAGCTSFDTSGCQARFEEQNVGGDPTVVDHLTGLEWVVTNDSGSGLLDKDNIYRWSTGTNDADGSAFTTYITGLNNIAYGGHTDWRLPSSGGCCGIGFFAPAELESIVDCSFGNPCIDQALFGPTESSEYWSAATFANQQANAWVVDFSNGSVTNVGKTDFRHVRAVRGGL